MDDNGPGSKQPLNPTNEDSANTGSLAEGTEKLPTCSTADRPTRGEPRLIGDFRIVRLIGAGGMGVVYEAEQQHPKRPVALKVIRGDRYLDDTAIKLFQREAQVLARLKHPAIAAIYESGRTEDGEHFFAMELVRGQTLADWLDKRPASQGLSSDELELRLRIFRRICEGVAYAHQRGVVHRDLKPTNILIFDDEGSGSASDTTGAPGVKILDFGLARITDTDVAATTLVTDAGTIRGTLSYMSPEQIRGNPDEIDMRTDIYSLGVVFYQLLTGDLPYEVLGKPMHEISRAICEEPPKSLVSAWKGSSRPDRDIETITFKALEKSASRRYQSVTALEEDIDRFLRNQPILARPASAVYQLRKMVQRHKVPFYSAAAILLLLTGSVIALSVQASTIAHERDRANQEARNALAVTEFLVQLFAVADPTEARDKDITARELLDRGVDQMSGDLEQQPEVRAALSGVLGRVYLNLGVFDQAAPLLEEASVLQGELYGQQSAEAAQVAGNLAVLYMMTGEFAKAESRMNESLALRRILYGDRSSEVAEGLYHAASLHLHKGEFQAAIPLLEEALSTEQELSSGQNEATANIISDLAYSAIKLGRDDEAERLNREALAQRREILGDDHPSVAQSLNNLGQSLRNRGDFDEAEQMIREAVALNRRIYGEHHPELNATLSSLASVLRDSNKLEEAEQVLREIVAGNRKTYGDAHPDVAGNLVMLGSVLERQGEPVAAESQYREALDIQRKVFAGDSWQIATTKNLLASSLISQGRHREAEPHLVESFQIISNTFGDDHPRTAAARRRVIANYEAWGKDGLADPYRRTGEE